MTYSPSRATTCTDAPALRAICAPLPGFNSMQCTSEPIGMFFSGSALPGLIGASTPDMIGSPTCARFGAKM